MAKKSEILLLVTFVATALVKGDAGMNYHHYHNTPKEKSIECYQCNSLYDPRCGDPFDPYTIGKVNCSLKPQLNHIPFKPTLCRKIIQKVQGKTRIIRGCGYVPHDRDDKECFIRTGTKDVHVRYCACKHNLCNGTPTLGTTRILLSLVMVTIYYSI